MYCFTIYMYTMYTCLLFTIVLFFFVDVIILFIKNFATWFNFNVISTLRVGKWVILHNLL